MFEKYENITKHLPDFNRLNTNKAKHYMEKTEALQSRALVFPTLKH